MSSDGLCIFKKAGNRWRVIIVQGSQFLLGPIKMWKKRAIMFCCWTVCYVLLPYACVDKKSNV